MFALLKIVERREGPDEDDGLIFSVPTQGRPFPGEDDYKQGSSLSLSFLSLSLRFAPWLASSANSGSTRNQRGPKRPPNIYVTAKSGREPRP